MRDTHAWWICPRCSDTYPKGRAMQTLPETTHRECAQCGSAMEPDRDAELAYLDRQMRDAHDVRA